LSSFADTSTAYFTAAQFLDGRTQRDRSEVVSTLWDDEPNRAKWSLLGNAFSVLKGSLGPDKTANYMDFMNAVQPRLNIIHKDEIFEAFGYDVKIKKGKIIMTSNGMADRQRMLKHAYVGTLSTRNIIEIAWKGGFKPSPQGPISTGGQNGSQPNPTAPPAAHTQVFAANANHQPGAGHGANAAAVPNPVNAQAQILLPVAFQPPAAQNPVAAPGIGVNAHFDLYNWVVSTLDEPGHDAVNMGLEDVPGPLFGFDGLLFDM
jgi:hypothetical protein